MNFIKSLLIVCLVLGMTSCATSQRTTVVAPARGVVVTKISKPRVIVHRNTNYYLSNGVWYTRNNRGYVAVAAPRGAVIRTLPRGYKVRTIRGVKYYNYNGVYYKRTGKRYVVVKV